MRLLGERLGSPNALIEADRPEKGITEVIRAGSTFALILDYRYPEMILSCC